MQISPYSILPFISGIIIFFLGLLIFLTNFRKKTNQLFFGMSFCASAWLLSYATVYSLNDPSYALTIIKLAQVPIIFIPIFSYHYALALSEHNIEKTTLFIAYFTSILLSLGAISTNYFITGINKYFFGFYGKAGPLYFLIILFFCGIAIRFFYILFKTSLDIKLSTRQRQQTKYFLTALAIAFLSSVDFLPKFGFGFYPPGCIFILIFVLLAAHVILKHQLLDINIVIKKGLIYSLLAAVITALYFLFIIILEKFFRWIVGYQSFFINLFAIFTISVLFNPLRNQIQNFLDRRFFQGTVSELSAENTLLRQEMITAKRLKSVAILASGLAHEIRNPLTAIKTFTEYLPQKLTDKEFLLKFSEIAHREVGRINELIDQLLDFSKPRPLKIQSVDVNKLITDILSFLNSSFITHNIHVSENLCPSLSILSADPNQLKQAILNILLNAIDAMPNGGTLSVATIFTNIQTSNQVIRIIITDTGSGITPQDLPHIFDPFFSKKGAGTGLGLAVTHGIIQQHGGRILVASIFGKGTTFTLELPTNKKGSGNL